MLDEARLRLDDAGNERLAFGQLDRLEQRPFVRVARIGRLERQCGRPRGSAMSMMSMSGLTLADSIHAESPRFEMRIGLWSLLAEKVSWYIVVSSRI